MRGSLRKIIGYSLAAVFVVWAIHTIISTEDGLPEIHWNASLLSMFVLAVLGVVVLNSVLIEECAQLVGRKVGFAKAVAVGFIVTLANYFLPLRGGLLIRLAAYSRLAGHDSFALGSVLTSSSLFSQLLFANILAILISVRMEIPYWYWALILGSVVLSLATYFAWPVVRHTGLKKYKFLRRITESSYLFFSNGGIVAMKVAVISIALLLFTAVRYILIGDMLVPSENITIFTALAIAAAASISSIISITSGGFGVREWAVVLAAGLFGVSPSSGLIFALVDRALVTFVLIPFGIYFGLWAKKNSLFS